MADRQQYPSCFGPYLRYAIDSDFENFSTDLENFGKQFRIFDESQLRLFLFVEVKRDQSVQAFEQAMNAHDQFGTQFGPDVGKTQYATLRCLKAAVTDQEYAIPIWRQYVSRVELSLPIKPASKPLKKFDIHDRSDEGKTPPGSLLIGLLDDGCPFAASQFLKTLTSGGVSTRVRAIWDQNRDKQPVTINGSDFGQTLPDDFDYGLEYRRDFAPALAAGKIGLDDWIGLHSTPANGIDEDSCYAEAGFTSLAFQTAHGAHVMDVLAGTIPLSSRLGPFPPGDRRDPPSWKPGTDAASTAEVVFVQFSDDNLRDASGVWLPGYALQAIQYVLSFAKLNVTNNVIINLSYGPTTGPHDGLWQLETALTALVSEYNGTGGKPKLDVVLAAGNSYLTESHVVFRGHQQPDQVEWIWRLPPDNTVLCFAEVWMKTVDAADIVVTLTSPSGTSYSSNVVTPNPSPAGVGSPTPGSSDDTMWRLEVKPTVATAGLLAEHGDWTIKVTGVPEHAAVHAYVARTDPNMNMITGAKRSFFVDGEWEQTRSASASCTLVDGEFDKSGSLIHRHGTLNGTATAEDSSVHVAGGYVVLDGRKSPYSSAGPARRGPLPYRRVGPDYVMPCDESYALQGILAGGTRSGSVFRLIGTSAAAPQLARWVVDASLPIPTDVPTSPVEIEKRGGGDLAPP
jgi:hypothetical protein